MTSVEQLAFLRHLAHEPEEIRRLTNLVNRQRQILRVMADALEWCAGTYADAVARQALAKLEAMRR